MLIDPVDRRVETIRYYDDGTAYSIKISRNLCARTIKYYISLRRINITSYCMYILHPLVLKYRRRRDNDCRRIRVYSRASRRQPPFTTRTLRVQ